MMDPASLRAPTSESWVSIDAVAAHIGVGKDSIYRWIERRGFPASKVGKLWKFRLSAVDAWMEARAAKPASGASSPALAPSRQRVALVVDDDVLVRDSVSDFLADRGMRVVTAADGREALASMRATARLPDVVVLDLGMPLLDGWQFRAQQLADERLARVPVVVVTAARPDGLDDGCVVLRKPLRLRQLAAAIDQLARPSALGEAAGA